MRPTVWCLALALGCGASAKPPQPPPPHPGATADAEAPDAPGAVVGAPDAAVLAPDSARAAGDVAPPAVGKQIVVSAGELDRQNSIVSFSLPPGTPSQTLRDPQGVSLPVQVDESGRAVFVLPSLKAGAQATFTLEPAARAPEVKAIRESDGVKLAIGAAIVVRYQMQGKLPPGIEPWYLRGGYLHPIYTPGGVLVSDDYTNDHHAHHGIWSAWAPVTFEGKEINFWAMGERTGKGDFDSLVGTWDGPVHGGLRAKQVQVSLAGAQPKTAINELWTVTLYKTHAEAPPYYVFDLDSTQETATMSPVMIHQHIYGGFAFRGHAQWNGVADFLTSEGRTRANGDGTTGRWCFIGGRVDGKPVGYAALGHPCASTPTIRSSASRPRAPARSR
jgi:hypothetical protein